MFSLEKTKVKLNAVNARAEIHGDERVPAFDLSFSMQSSNDVLIEFHSSLRAMLYKEPDTPDLVDQANPGELTALRFPQMGTIKWSCELTSCDVVVDYGLGGQSDIALAECTIDNFKFHPQEGGTVITSFRVICHPKTADVGRLCEFIQRDVEISVIPPEPTTIGELFGEAA